MALSEFGLFGGRAMAMEVIFAGLNESDVCRSYMCTVGPMVKINKQYSITAEIGHGANQSISNFSIRKGTGRNPMKIYAFSGSLR